MLVITDYFVIATGANDRQVRTIAEEVEKALKDNGLAAIGREGEQEGKWILLDFVDVVVHVFQAEERDFYRIEKLWSDAPRVPLPPEVANATPGSDQPAEEETEETLVP